MQLPNILKIVSKRLASKGFKAIVVGGSIRDHFLKLPIKDYDIEVFGLDSIDELENILREYGKVSLVGKSFGVLKFTYNRETYDFSCPRVERKISKGHRGFSVTCLKNATFKEASLRRDFTINSMGFDIENREFLDPFCGKFDMQNRLLRHINTKSFIEDPLRVYRAIQFSARFNYTLSKSTFKLCQEMVRDNLLDELPQQRVYIEFQKLLLKAQKPSIGFNLMEELGILRYFPELNLDTLPSLDIMAKYRVGDNRRDLTLSFAILCSNLELESAKSFLYRLTNEHKFIDSILIYIKYHNLLDKFYNRKLDRDIRKLSTKIDIKEFILFEKILNLDNSSNKIDWLEERAKELNVYNNPLKPLLRGKDLIELGLTPSKDFRRLLKVVFKAQLNGRVSTYNEAMEFLKSYLVNYKQLKNNAKITIK